MLQPNYKTKVVMNSMLRNYSVGKHFGLDKTKGALMDVMVKHNITTDPSKLKGYQREAFLKDVEKSGIGFEAKRAFREHYGPQKPEPSKLNSVASQQAAHRAQQNLMPMQNNAMPQKKPGLTFFGLGRSNMNVREAEGRDLIAHVDNKSGQQKLDDARARIKDIEG